MRMHHDDAHTMLWVLLSALRQLLNPVKAQICCK